MSRYNSPDMGFDLSETQAAAQVAAKPGSKVAAKVPAPARTSEPASIKAAPATAAPIQASATVGFDRSEFQALAAELTRLDSVPNVDTLPRAQQAAHWAKRREVGTKLHAMQQGTPVPAHDANSQAAQRLGETTSHANRQGLLAKLKALLQ